MEDDKQQVTFQQWAERQAAAIVRAAQARAEGDPDLTMTIIGKLLVSLVHETQIRAQDVPMYPGFQSVFEMLSDHIEDFSKGGKRAEEE